MDPSQGEVSNVPSQRSSSKDGSKDETKDTCEPVLDKLRAQAQAGESLEATLDRLIARGPTRERLPEERNGVTKVFRIQDGSKTMKVYITPNTYPNGKIGEVFLKVDKQGHLASGALDAVATCMSVGLQYGIPLESFTSKLRAMRFDPAGFTGDTEFPTCSSVLDLVARFLEARFGGGK
jgi:ribonucleoside-diphosphate reductase alpha chain